MATPTINPDHIISYYPAHQRPWLVIDAPHAAEPQADAFTGPIAQNLVAATGGHGLIALISRTEADLNRPRSSANAWAMDAYRHTLKRGLNHCGLTSDAQDLQQPVIHLCIHGMKDYHGHAIEIGTAPGWGRDESASAIVRDGAMAHAQQWWVDSGRLQDSHALVCNGAFYGFSVLGDHRWGDPQDTTYPGYGAHYHCLQIELSRTLREHRTEEVVDWLSALADHLKALADAKEG